MDADEPTALTDHRADPSLTRADAVLPVALGRPPAVFADSSAGRLVGAGVAMTGATLLGGAALSIFGLVELLRSGGAIAVILLGVGLVLVATHWGWVHVAQLITDRRRGVTERAEQAEVAAWLAGIDPYARWEVRSRVRAEDAAIILELAAFTPVPVDAATFRFVTEVRDDQIHPADTPTAVVVEAAEELRREAAARTAAARAAWNAQAERTATAELRRADRAADADSAAAAATALSDHLNAQDPPLPE